MNAVERIFRSLIAGSIILAAIVSCGRKNDYHELTGYAQGGTYSVRFSTRGVKTGTDEIKRAVDSILTMVDTTLSGYNKGSQLSRYNAGAQVEPNGMFREIFTVSKRLYEETGGAWTWPPALCLTHGASVSPLIQCLRPVRLTALGPYVGWTSWTTGCFRWIPGSVPA